MLKILKKNPFYIQFHFFVYVPLQKEHMEFSLGKSDRCVVSPLFIQRNKGELGIDFV